jgi:hypothetical protein
MFNVYIDDSGTSPNQRVAIASALLIPVKRVRQLEKEWKQFCDKRHIEEFHSSECVARNQKSAFANWTDPEVDSALARVRQISKKFGVKAFSWAVNKSDYDEVVPDELREVWGRYHYTWAIHHVLKLIRAWRGQSGQPFEYFFDWLKDKPRKEVERAMSQEESIFPGQYEEHYVLKNRRDVPALQCADLVAWSCFSRARLTFDNIPMNRFSERTFSDLRNYQNKTWLTARTTTREELIRVMERNLPQE